MYLCNYNNVLVRKYVSLFIPLVKIVGLLGPCVRFPYSWHFLLGEKCLQYFMGKLLYFPRYEKETSTNFYTFLDIKTRIV